MQCQEWLKKDRERYMSHDNQNEFLKLMAVNILRQIASKLQSTDFITIMIDECTDVANKEQVSNFLTKYTLPLLSHINTYFNNIY